MLSLMNRALHPSASFSDKITYLTAVHHTQSIYSDNGVVTAEKIRDLLTSSKSKLQGLLLLEIGLEQNPEIYVKGRWVVVLLDILRDSNSQILKNYACKLICVIIPYMIKDPASTKLDLQRFAENVLHHVLDGMADDCDWFEAACKVVSKCQRCFPQAVGKLRVSLNELISKHLSQSVSSKTFELVGEIYSQMPLCVQSNDSKNYLDSWAFHYCQIFYAMQEILNSFLSFMSNDPYAGTHVDIRFKSSLFDNESPATDVYEAHIRGVQRYVNLCKCLAKMLSTKSRYPVDVPVKLTITGLTRLFQVQDIAKVKPTTVELQVFYSSLSQMQIASLLVLESLIVNFDLVPYSMLVAQLLFSALQSSKMFAISSEPIYHLRLTAWIFLNKWITVHGNKVCGDIVVHPHIALIDELLKDISIYEKEAPQTNTPQMGPKSKKTVSASWVNKNYYNPIQRKVCKAALKTLENLVYTGINHVSIKMHQEMFTKVSQTATALISSLEPCPFPYDDDSCRKSLYAVLLAFTVNSKPNQREPMQYSSVVFKKALRDPSIKVTRFCHKAMAICRLSLHPKRPSMELKDSGKQNRASKITRFPQWSTEEFVPNLPQNVPPDNVHSRVAQRTYHNPNESAIEEDEAMDEDEESHYSEHGYQEYSEPYINKYPEHVSSSHRNGDDILEIMNSSEGQEDVDSEDEKDDDEEEGKSYEDEDIQEGDIPAENICLPNTSKVQAVNPVHIVAEPLANNVAESVSMNVEHPVAEEPESDSIKQSTKPQTSSECNQNKPLNGVRNLVPDQDLPSTSGLCLTSENGIDNSEEEECEEEEEEEMDEEEEIGSFPAEKKTPEYDTSVPPSKKQKFENDEGKDKPLDEGRSRSPTLEEMKSSFRCDLVTDITKS